MVGIGRTYDMMHAVDAHRSLRLAGVLSCSSIKRGGRFNGTGPQKPEGWQPLPGWLAGATVG